MGKVSHGETRWMFWPIGVLQLVCFVMHDYLFPTLAVAAKAAPARQCAA